jgi:hypothetical protein
MTPLYKKLKTNGTSFYAFPGAAEDISAAYQNANYKMYFSKYVLLNFPVVNNTPNTAISITDPRLTAKPIFWDFDDTSGTGLGFKTTNYTSANQTYQNKLVESLRNYVANQEVVIKESKLNNTEYYYDNTVLDTPTEKIFWKWCKKLGLISLELATEGDEYFGNLLEFQANSANDPEYLPEYLWREREQIEHTIVKFIDEGSKLKIEFESGVDSRFQLGDVIEFLDVRDSRLYPGYIVDGRRARVVRIDQAAGTVGQQILTDMDYGNTPTEIVATGTVTLVYHRLVQYIGEVNGINNVQESNRSYTEVYAHIPDSTGKTPDILFRTRHDKNYTPNMTFPILPSQYQPEIMGAEVFTNPIVSNPNNYPGSYYGQFDTEDFTYETSSGDKLRRSGDYFGISGTRDNQVVDPSSLDGISLDFDPAHYVKMNIFGKEITNFDQFNSLEINNQPPQDFEFNAILWYYTVEDLDGNQQTNLYGISFVDNPDNNPIPAETGLRVPAFRKLAANSTQDGVSYAFSLNLNFNIINENPVEAYNPTPINSLFNFNLFNESMRRLSRANDGFMNIMMTQNQLQTDVLNIKQLIYSQTDFATINKKIANLELLLRLYSNNQMVDSNTIRVELDNTSRPPNIKLHNIDPSYFAVTVLKTSEMYNVNGAIPYEVSVPNNKSFLLYVQNDDINEITLPNNDKLTIVLDKDLAYKQYFDIIVDANSTATQNKQLEVFVRYQYADSQNPVVSKLMETIDLPVYQNTYTRLANSAATRDKFEFRINLNESLVLDTNGIVNIPIDSDYYLVNNSIKKGDTLVLSDFTVGTVSTIDLSGQYRVDRIGATNSYIYLDINSNKTFVNYGASQSLPFRFNSPSNYLLSSYPSFKLNKGYKFRITRILASNLSELSKRYYVERTEM